MAAGCGYSIRLFPLGRSNVGKKPRERTAQQPAVSRQGQFFRSTRASGVIDGRTPPIMHTRQIAKNRGIYGVFRHRSTVFRPHAGVGQASDKKFSRKWDQVVCIFKST
jgi:hypothetical protein